MHFVYIIYSAKRNRYYVGMCENVEKRLIKHNTNHAGFTGKTLDWELKWTELHPDKLLARKRELQIKNWKSRIMIKDLIKTL